MSFMLACPVDPAGELIRAVGQYFPDAITASFRDVNIAIWSDSDRDWEV